MAEKKTEAAQPVEDVFDVAEIAQNAPKLFGYSVDLANTALSLAGVERCTLNQAKSIIKEFAERKVK